MIQLISQDEVVSISKWAPIIKSYKYEMKPTKNQEVEMNQTLSTCRHLYNDTLEERKKGYENGGWNVQYKHQQNYLPTLRNKNDETGKYLQEVYEQVEQDVLKRVDKAYKRYFERVQKNKEGNGQYKKPGFPRFKGYGRYKSFTFPQYGKGCQIIYRYGNKDEKGDIIRLSKIGEIKFIKYREIGDIGVPYLIKTVTVKKEVDKWFISFAVETFAEIEIPVGIYAKQKEIKTIEELNKKSVGIDMGLSNLATLSNGKKIEPPEYLRESEKKLAKHQRKLSRKKREEKEIEILDKDESKKESKTQGKKVEVKIKKKIKVESVSQLKLITVNSNNREKERIKVAKIHRKIVNQRKNFNHEVSRTLVNNFDLIAFEKLNIQGMVQNHHLAKSISDASWYQLQMFTSYKAEWAGKIVEFVDPKYTSQNCSRCGKLVGRVAEGEIFVCPFCGLTINVHVNAGINIRSKSPEYQRLLKEIEKSTPATGGRACLSSLTTDTMIQEALLNTKDGNLADTKLQAPPFRAG